jgi:hypothetical protein
MRPRGEDEWYGPAFVSMGQAHAISGDADEQPSPIAVLWIPDPEQRRGWREKYLYAEKAPERRAVGFRKP